MQLNSRSSLVLLLLSLCFGFAPSVRAELVQTDDPGVTEAAELVPKGYESPSEVLRALVEGINENSPAGFERATRALDLSWIPEADRSSRGEALAQTLKRDVLDRLGIVDYSDRALEVSSYARTHDWDHGQESRQKRFQFVKSTEGRWLLAAKSVREIESMARDLADLEVSEEVLAELPFFERMRHRMRSALPPVLLERSFLLENWQWCGLVLLIFLGVVADRIVRFLFARLAARIANSKRLQLDKGVLTNFERPFGIFVTAGLFVWFLPILGIDRQIVRILDLAGSFILTIAGIWAAYRLVDVFCGYLAARAANTSNKFDDMLVPLMRRTLKIVVSVVGLVFIASRLSEDLWHILAGLSIGSLAVGFAAKDSIENLFGTFTVLMDKPFQLGDWITVGDIDGSVEEVGFRSTRVRTFYNSVITVPNSRFISAHVDNMGERRYRRVKTMLSLTYDTPPEKLEAFCEAVRELLRQHPYTRKDTFYVYFNAWSASSIDVLLYCFLRCPDWGTELREKHRLYVDILKIAERLGVGFAFPTQTLHIAKPEDLEHADRPASGPEGVQRGRDVAREVAKEGLAGFEGRPPVFEMADIETQSAPAKQESSLGDSDR